MSKRYLNSSFNKNKLKSCKLDALSNTVGSNFRNFYGSKKPISNFRWMPKKSGKELQDSESINDTKINVSEKVVFRKSTAYVNKKTVTEGIKKSSVATLNGVSKGNCSSPRRTPRRLCRHNNTTNAPLKNLSTGSSQNKISKRLVNNISNEKSISSAEDCSSPRRIPERLGRNKDNISLVSHSKQKSTQIQKLKALSQEIEQMDDLKESNEKQSVQTQTSLSSSQDTTNLSSISKSPVTSCRSSPFLFTTDIEDAKNPTDSYKSKDEPQDQQEEEEIYEMFNCDLESHNTSIRSDISDTSSLTSPKKKMKDSKTILNYFSRLDTTQNERKSKKNKSPSHRENNHKQLHFSNKGLSPTSSKPEEDSLLFDLPTTTKAPSKNKRKNMRNKSNNMEQMYIDIGQKDFGHVTCDTCGMIYTKCQEEDEAQHAKYHQNIVQKLKFNGWKSERVLEEFHDGRIISIQSNDHFMHLKKFSEIRQVVDTELGFATSNTLNLNVDEQAFLFISSKKVIGCSIAVSIRKAYPVLVNSDMENEECGSQSWCCSSNPVKAVCGISRIWVFSKNRRQKIASRLVECIRRNFLYGCVIEKDLLAFSDPTPNGRIFAETYVEKKEILVFR